MAWKQSGQPTIQRQRGKWVAWVEGIDTETGKRRPRQIGTYPSKRAVQRAATAFPASGEALAERDTVAGLVDRWVASRVDVGPKTRLQYEWAAGHIREGSGEYESISSSAPRSPAGSTAWRLPASFSRRSIQIFRMVLRAALADGVDVGELRRSPAARVGLPKQVAKPVRERPADVWTEAELDRLLTTTESHRWIAPIRLCATYGLRHSEMLGLTWSAVGLDAGTICIERALVEVPGRSEWTDGKNERSRRTIPIDATTLNPRERHHPDFGTRAEPNEAPRSATCATEVGRPAEPSRSTGTSSRLPCRSAGRPQHTGRCGAVSLTPRSQAGHSPMLTTLTSGGPSR